jgi:hypothetical protein
MVEDTLHRERFSMGFRPKRNSTEEETLPLSKKTLECGLSWNNLVQVSKKPALQQKTPHCTLCFSLSLFICINQTEPTSMPDCCLTRLCDACGSRIQGSHYHCPSCNICFCCGTQFMPTLQGPLTPFVSNAGSQTVLYSKSSRESWEKKWKKTGLGQRE